MIHMYGHQIIMKVKIIVNMGHGFTEFITTRISILQTYQSYLRQKCTLIGHAFQS